MIACLKITHSRTDDLTLHLKILCVPKGAYHIALLTVHESSSKQCGSNKHLAGLERKYGRDTCRDDRTYNGGIKLFRREQRTANLTGRDGGIEPKIVAGCGIEKRLLDNTQQYYRVTKTSQASL